MARAGKELSRKANPGSGLGRSLKFESLTWKALAHPADGPRQWASQIDPLPPAGGNSSQATHRPPCLSVTIADPCEYCERGTDSTARGGPEVDRSGKTAILIGEVTPTPVHEP